jgi:hypothetical protein
LTSADDTFVETFVRCRGGQWHVRGHEGSAPMWVEIVVDAPTDAASFVSESDPEPPTRTRGCLVRKRTRSHNRMSNAKLLAVAARPARRSRGSAHRSPAARTCVSRLSPR